MPKINWCSCKEHNSRDFSVITNIYCRHFIPSGWALDYKTIDTTTDKSRTLYITGYCSVCGGFMRTGTSLPVNYTGSNLIAKIYHEMTNYRPYCGKDTLGIYHDHLSQRVEWYKSQDNMSDDDRREVFYLMFRKKDRNSVHRWLFPRPVKELLEIQSNKLRIGKDQYGYPCIPKNDSCNNEEMRELIRSFVRENRNTFLISKYGGVWDYNSYIASEFIGKGFYKYITDSNETAKAIVKALNVPAGERVKSWKSFRSSERDYIRLIWN